MKVSITFLLTFFSIIASYGQNKDSINYFLQSELIFSASWMDEYSKTGEVQIIHQKGNYYFLYQYRRNGSLQFISEVETCFLERIRYEDDTLTGFKKEVISRIPGFRVSGYRASYDKKEKIF